MRTSHKLKMQENIVRHWPFWLAIFNHACKEMSPFAINASTYTCGFRINANLVMEELIDLKVLYKYIYMLTRITIMHYR